LARPSVTKSRAPASAKTIKTTPTKTKAAKTTAAKTTNRTTRTGGKPVPPSKKRSAMPDKTAKAAPKAAGTKPAAKSAAPTSAKPAAVKTPAKAAAPKAAAVKPQAAAKAPTAKVEPKVEARPVAPKAAVKPAAPAMQKPLEKAAEIKPAAAKAPAAAAPKPPVKAEEPKKPTTQRQGFKTNEFVVYPAHGVGQILAIEEQEIAGLKLELFVINFIKDKMTLRVPTAKVANVGMRKLSDPSLVKRALETLKGRARIKRTMWSRRAQEYEAKINSGDIVAIAEVVRDLFRSDSQPEQSYSERQLYEAALDRLSREIAAVQHVTETEAVKEIEGQLAKSPRRGAKAEADGEADGEADDDSAVADEAA
jgi:CarD family transcriptional regulator